MTTTHEVNRLADRAHKMARNGPLIGDVVKYGPDHGQWGMVIDLDLGMKKEICVRRRNRIWVKRSDIEIIVPAKAFLALRNDVWRGEPFTNGAS